MMSFLMAEMLNDRFTEGVAGQSTFEYFSHTVKHLDAFVEWLLATIFGSMKSLTDVTGVTTSTICVNSYVVSQLATINPFHK